MRIGSALTFACDRTLELIVRTTYRYRGHERLARLGSRYGGWVVPIDRIPRGAICYCVGAGEDITFDLELVRRLGCHVYTIDPTPRAQVHFSQVTSGMPGLRFVSLGLWSSSGRMRFYAPGNRDHVSHSIVNIHRTRDYFEVDCVTLTDLMKRLGHTKLDLLKLDIEGAEFEVLESMLAAGIPVPILCVEFHGASPRGRVLGMIRQLQRAGYRLLDVEHMNFTFLNLSISAEHR